MIGRSNSALSETRRMVFWNVDRAPNKGRNCFGCTSREAGQSRVPAPPHMISGTILPAISTSNLVVVAIPRDKIANAIFDRRVRLETDVAHQIAYVRIGFHDVARLHR